MLLYDAVISAYTDPRAVSLEFTFDGSGSPEVSLHPVSGETVKVKAVEGATVNWSLVAVKADGTKSDAAFGSFVAENNLPLPKPGDVTFTLVGIE